MKQIVIIDTKTEIGKSVVELLGVLAHNNSSISFLTDEEIEKKEDEVMAEMIRTGIESGKGDKNELFEYLDIKECK